MYIFRKAIENDYESICQLISSEDELFYVYPKGKYPLTIEQLRKLAEVRTALTVAVDNDKVIGFANFYNYEKNKTAFIGNVVIDKLCRGKGAGKALVVHMLNQAFVDYHLPEVRISVFSENTPALLLYAGFGFVPYKVEQRINPAGKKLALVHMVLDRNSHC